MSGTAPRAPDGTITRVNDKHGQTKHCLKIIKRAIADAEGSLENIIRTRIMLKDISKWELAAKAHGEFFSKIRPAYTFVEVKDFTYPDWLVEVEADCVIKNEDKSV